MKKIAFILTIIAISFASCSPFKPVEKPASEEPKAWEYKVVKITDKDEATQNATINTLSLEGWELVNTYTEISTGIGRSGYSEYINVRTTSINMIFKRPQSAINATQPVE